MAYKFTRLYSANEEPVGDIMGTLTLSIPRARGFHIDRRGRKIRNTDKFSIKIRKGRGMNQRSFVSYLKKNSDEFRDTYPTVKWAGKLISILKGKV
jgi:hypothetical protein